MKIKFVPSGYDPRLDIYSDYPKWFNHFSLNRAYSIDSNIIINLTGLSVFRILVSDLEDYYWLFKYNGIFRNVDENPQLSANDLKCLQQALYAEVSYKSPWLKVLHK